MTSIQLIDNIMKNTNPSKEMVKIVMFAGAHVGNTDYIKWAHDNGSNVNDVLDKQTEKVLKSIGLKFDNTKL